MLAAPNNAVPFFWTKTGFATRGHVLPAEVDQVMDMSDNIILKFNIEMPRGRMGIGIWNGYKNHVSNVSK